MKNWKTNIIGIILMIVAIGMYIKSGDWVQSGLCFATGTGFLFTKDFDKTGTK